VRGLNGSRFSVFNLEILESLIGTFVLIISLVYCEFSLVTVSLDELPKILIFFKMLDP
jgi:hypothetical protein